MSQFDKYTQSEYVRGICSFLGKQHPAAKTFMELKLVGSVGRKGRLPRYAESAVADLEAAVNAQAERCESETTSLADRYLLARAYTGMKDSNVARKLNVSREIVRRWRTGVHRPSCLEKLAKVLDVPLTWLQFGGDQYLPADTHLGVRIGEEALNCREKLYSMTISIIGDVPDDIEGEEVIAYLENAVMTYTEMSRLARQCGGRWHVVDGEMVFAPWIPIEPHGLSRRDWNDAVEAIIEEELSARHSVYAASKAVQRRCEVLGLAYPKLISLHKRVAKERERENRYGIDINARVSVSCQQCGQRL